MLNRLFSAFSRPSAPAAAPSIAQVEHFPDAPLHWFSDTSMPIPDWEQVALQQPEQADAAARDQWWTAAAGQWLLALAQHLGSPYRIHASDDFLLLSALEPRPAQLFLEFCQSVRRRILRNLGDIGTPRCDGKHVVLVFSDVDEYYRYVGNYYPEEGEFAMSSGMFLQHGYGHFVLPQGEMEHMQPVIAHELTHCLLAHLSIPAWLNEGLATNTEAALFPHLNNPYSAQYHPSELAQMHATFWNAETIQEFWSGKSFLRPDQGNLLSYDLAKRITARAAKGEDRFRAFVREAEHRDAGLAAEHQLGYPLEHLIIGMLGEGEWRPRPELWNEGVERGQF